MHPIKGFSLIEVLIALSLICSIFLFLTEQQLQTRHTINQLLLRVDASHLLDDINEQSWSQNKPALIASPAPYELTIKPKSSGFILRLEWLNGIESLTREYTL